MLPSGYWPPPQASPTPAAPSDVDLDGVLVAAPLAVGVTRGPEHTVELLNPAAGVLLGIPSAARAQAVGRPLRAVAPALTTSGVLEVLDHVYAAGEPHPEPQQYMLRPDDERGTPRIISLTCHPRHCRDLVIGVRWYGLDVTEQVHASRRLQLLVNAGPALLEASLEHQDALDQAARLAVSALGDLCVINLLQPDGSLMRATVVHANPELTVLAEQLKLLPSLPDSPNRQVLASGRPILLRLQDSDPWAVASRGLQELHNRLGLASALVVPLRARGRMVGTFAVGSTQPDRYTDEDIALAEGIALRAALALDTAALYDSERRARELADRAAAGAAGLLRITATLSGAVSPAAVAQVLVSQGTELIGAQGAALFVQVPEGLRLVDATGWSPTMAQKHQIVPLTCSNPLTDTVLARNPMWMESHADLLARYPRSAKVHRTGGYEAAACLPLIVEDAVLGVINFSFTARRTFHTDDRTLMLTLAGQCAQALDRARLYAAEQDARAAAERQRDRIGMLAEASLVLDAPQSQQQRLQQLTQLAVPRIADWCAVHLVRDGRVEQIAYAHSDPDKIAFVEQLTRRYPPRQDDLSSGAAQVIRTGTAKLIQKISDTMLSESAQDATHLELIRALGATSAMIVPLTVHGRTVGAITLVAAESGQHFDAEDLAFARNLATRAALALDNARLYEEQRGIAATLQAALLPHELPVIPGVELAGRYVAAGESNEVGGDLYDVFCCCRMEGYAESDPWSLVIGDVCGKGTAAAALTALIRYTVRAEASHLLPPGEVLRRLNEAIIRQLTTSNARFCTVLYGQLTVTSKGPRLRMASAGHLAPRVLRRNGTVEVGIGGGTILGVYADPTLACEEVHLSSGDTLLLVTDGVTEARGPGGCYGEPRLDALLTRCTGHSANAIADLIIEDVLRFQAGAPRDDIAVLAVQAAESDPAETPESAGERHQE